MGTHQLAEFKKKLGSGIGRESKKSYTNEGKVFFGDYNFKSERVRATRSVDKYKWATAKSAIEAAPYNFKVDEAFKRIAKLSDWTLFNDEFVDGKRVGANFQGSEDFSYLLVRAKTLYDYDNTLWLTALSMDFYII